jgi:curli biogenesis system outer membrane secretion channel CsgG
MKLSVVAALSALALVSAGVAQAKPQATASDTPQVPTCARSLGTLSIQEDASHNAWTTYGLQGPASLLRVIVQQSHCFSVVERGAGLDAAMRERELASGGQLQHGSNVGGGQIKAADYVLLAGVVDQNNNASGGGGFAGLGGLIGHSNPVFGAVVGGISVKSQTAQTTLTLTNVRTTESFSAEGNAKNKNWSWGGVGFVGGGGGGLGGYTNTDVGKVVTMAFIDAYSSLVQQTGAPMMQQVTDTAAAPKKTYVTIASTSLKSSPSASAKTVRTLPVGATVYPTGEKDGLWWHVSDENDNDGWVNNAKLEPAK